MSIINTQVQPFKAQAFHNGRFVEVSDETIKGRWSAFVFMPAAREWSLEELREVLKMLDVKMDVWFYESEVDEPSKVIVDELIARDIATDETSARRRSNRKDR